MKNNLKMENIYDKFIEATKKSHKREAINKKK